MKSTLHFKDGIELPTYLLTDQEGRCIAIESTYLVGDEYHYESMNAMISHVSQKENTAIYSTFVTDSQKGVTSDSLGSGLWGDVAFLLNLKTMDESLNLDHEAVLSPSLESISEDFRFDPSKLDNRRKKRAKLFNDKRLYDRHPDIYIQLAKFVLIKSVKKTPTILNLKGYTYSIKLTKRLVSHILDSDKKDFTIITEPALSTMIVETLTKNGFKLCNDSFSLAISI